MLKVEAVTVGDLTMTSNEKKLRKINGSSLRICIFWLSWGYLLVYRVYFLFLVLFLSGVFLCQHHFPRFSPLTPVRCHHFSHPFLISSSASVCFIPVSAVHRCTFHTMFSTESPRVSFCSCFPFSF